MDLDFVPEDIFFLSRGGTEYQMSVNTLLTVSLLSRMFSVDAASVWLKEYATSRVYAPNDDGEFPGFHPDITTRVVVEGRDAESFTTSPNLPSATTLSVTSSGRLAATPSGFGSTINSTLTTSNRRAGWSGFKSVVGSRPTTHLTKLLKAKMTKSPKTKKVSLDVIDQAFLEITESDANVNFISKHIVEISGPNWVLVSAEGVEIADSPATRGK